MSIPSELFLPIFVGQKTSSQDAKSGGAVEIWNTADAVFNVALQKGTKENVGGFISPAMLADISSLTCSILADSRTGPEIASKTLAQGDINAGLTPTNWAAWTDQHASFAFTFEELNFDLEGQIKKTFFLVIHGITTSVDPVTEEPRRITYGYADIIVYEDGVPVTTGPISGGNLIPGGATYDGAGHYTLAGLTANKVYRWTDGGANDTSVTNGTETVNTTNTNFTAQGVSIVLNGTAGQPVTAIVREPGTLSAAEMEARFLKKTGTESVIPILADDSTVQYLRCKKVAEGEYAISITNS